MSKLKDSLTEKEMDSLTKSNQDEIESAMMTHHSLCEAKQGVRAALMYLIKTNRQFKISGNEELTKQYFKLNEEILGHQKMMEVL